MSMKWHDGPSLSGFEGYDRANEDPNGVSPSGTSGDTHVRDTDTEPTLMQQAIGNKFLSGQITREEAERQLDMLAGGGDL